ncbi:MAG: HAD hydrolase-like protein [Isosphaeraceae bacterium]
MFDMDGTLLDSAPGVTTSAAQALAAVGAPVPAMEKLRRFVGPPMIESFRTVSQLDEKSAQKALQHYRKMYADHGAEQSSPYDGVIDLLEHLDSAGIPMAVATSKVEDQAIWGYGEVEEASQAAAVAPSPAALIDVLLAQWR